MILTLLLLLVLIPSLWVNYNIYMNLLKLEENYLELEDAKRKDEEFILELRSKALTYTSQLRQLDSQGAFEADDETGYFFSELKQMINEISTYFDIKTDVLAESADDFSTTIRSRYGEKA